VTSPEEPDEREGRWYLGVLLHALNQPLTAVASYAEAAGVGLRDDADPLLREALDAAREESARAIVIARELRAVLGSRGGAEPGALALNALLERMAPFVPSEAGVRVRLELDRAVADVLADELTLRRAVLALVKSGVARLGDADRITAVLRTRRSSEETRAEVELALETPPSPSTAESSAVPDAAVSNGHPVKLDPLASLARTAVTDLGGELILEVPGPGQVRYVLRLATA